MQNMLVGGPIHDQSLSNNVRGNEHSVKQEPSILAAADPAQSSVLTTGHRGATQSVSGQVKISPSKLVKESASARKARVLDDQ